MYTYRHRYIHTSIRKDQAAAPRARPNGIVCQFASLPESENHTFGAVCRFAVWEVQLAQDAARHGMA